MTLDDETLTGTVRDPALIWLNDGDSAMNLTQKVTQSFMQKWLSKEDNFLNPLSRRSHK